MAEGASNVQLQIKIKPTAGGEVVPVLATNNTTILELKEEISKQANAPSDQIRLIYKGMRLVFFRDFPACLSLTLYLLSTGQILKDHNTVASYGKA